MRKTLWTILLLLVGTTPALALSCRAPNFGNTFNRIAAAPELYHIAIGELEAVRTPPAYSEGKPRVVDYTFQGQQLTGGQRWRDGHGITARTTCLNGFCGALPPEGQPILLFVRDDPDGLTLASPPCRPDFLVNPSLGQRTAIRACLRAGECGAAEIEALDMAR